MFNKSKLVTIGLLLPCIGMLWGCGSQADTQSGAGASASLSLAYQYGLAYAPAVLAQEEHYIEDAYKELTGEELTVNWAQMSSGPDINVGISSGELDGGFMGVAPAVTGVSKDLGYKIFSNLSGQQHGCMTNDSSITSLADLAGSDKQIALVNTGSFQHIILGKALSEASLDPHALDSNIVAMAHPDGMAALESGNVACHLTSSPYIFKEQENSSLTELTEVQNAWTSSDSFIVGVASKSLYENNPQVYQALCTGIQKGIDLLNNDPEKAAEILHELDGNTAEQELDYIERGTYTSETSKLFDLAVFMGENGFTENAPASYQDLVFDNVKGN